jgi:prevent-host-death family protein
MEVGIRALKVNASSLVRRAAAGEVITVTDRGRPVACLVPWREISTVDQLIASGEADPPLTEGDLLDLEPLSPVPSVPLPSQILAELRRDER